MTDELPKQELLIKLLKMTTSNNDGEVLVAARKANALLQSAGWDWEKLITGKIVIVEDPFSKIDTPDNFARNPPRAYQPPQPPKPSAPPPPRQTQSTNPPWAQGPSRGSPPPNVKAPPPPPPPKAAKVPYSDKPNKFTSWCFCCGDTVPSDMGFIINPSKYNSRAPNKFVTICTSCNKANVPIGRSGAPRQKPLSAAPGGVKTPSLNDL
jgi:hypothetical protein